jgi:hypothetical protein
MTNSNPNPYLGERFVWVICTGQSEGTCSNYIPQDPDVPDVADWGGATASFGEVDQYRVYGKRISPLLIERYLDPDWVEDPDDDDQLPADILERIIPTWTETIVVSTEQRSQIHPAIELYDGEPENGEQAVAGIIDGTYYIYPVVFQDARFCYLPACSSSMDPPLTETCVWNEGGFPLEPYYPDCPTGPIYPMDAITRVEPSPDTSKTIRYKATWNYYRLDSDPDRTNLLTEEIELDMIVYAPAVDWAGLMLSLMEYTYFYNGIYH